MIMRKEALSTAFGRLLGFVIHSIADKSSRLKAVLRTDFPKKSSRLKAVLRTDFPHEKKIGRKLRTCDPRVPAFHHCKESIVLFFREFKAQLRDQELRFDQPQGWIFKNTRGFSLQFRFA